ncbi:MAG: hypothetical protein ABI682_14650 [Acidobacteriota bacterium]
MGLILEVFAQRSIPGPLRGVTAVTLDIGVMAIVVGVDCVVLAALSLDGVIWLPLLPLPGRVDDQ